MVPCPRGRDAKQAKAPQSRSRPSQSRRLGGEKRKSASAAVRRTQPIGCRTRGDEGMKKTTMFIGVLSAALASAVATPSFASDHDDGEPRSATAKNRNLNLSDHFAFRSPANPSEMVIMSYTNPRSLPGHVYTLATNARY